MFGNGSIDGIEGVDRSSTDTFPQTVRSIILGTDHPSASVRRWFSLQQIRVEYRSCRIIQLRRRPCYQTRFGLVDRGAQATWLCGKSSESHTANCDSTDPCHIEAIFQKNLSGLSGKTVAFSIYFSSDHILCTNHIGHCRFQFSGYRA